MTEHYKDLKRKLHQLDIDYGYLAACLKRSKSTIAKAMEGRMEFGINDCWMIMRVIQEDGSKLHEYFPFQGRIRS